MELIQEYEQEKVDTAAFYAKQVVDREMYEDISSVRRLPDYEEATPEVMISLATGVLNGEYRHAVEESTHDKEKWTTGDFIEHALELSGEPFHSGYFLEQRRSTQLDDEPVSTAEIVSHARQATFDTDEKPPDIVDADPENEDHRWVNLGDLGGREADLYSAYLPVVEMKDHDDREDPEFEEWP